MSKSKNKKKRLSKYKFMYRNQEKGNLPCIVSSFGRFFVASVLSIDTTCLSWYVELQPWNCVVHLFNAIYMFKRTCSAEICKRFCEFPNPCNGSMVAERV